MKTDSPGYRILARRLARELARPDRLRAAVANDPGALAQAVRLLRWWAEDCSDEPKVVEMIKQSKEVARSLERVDRAARQSHGRAWTVAVLARFREYERLYRTRGRR